MLPAGLFASMEHFPRNWLPSCHCLSCCSILVGLLLPSVIFSFFSALLPRPFLCQFSRCVCTEGKLLPSTLRGSFQPCLRSAVLAGQLLPGLSGVSQYELLVQYSGALATCLLNGLNKQLGKRHINSACLITSQSGSKGNRRFPRKLSRYAECGQILLQRASRRGVTHPGTWCRQSTAEPQNHQKQGRNCIAKCLSP